MLHSALLFAALQMLIFAQESTGGSGVPMGSAGLYGMLWGGVFLLFKGESCSLYI